MPKRSDYPLPREKYRARTLVDIRGMPHQQLGPQDFHPPKKKPWPHSNWGIGLRRHNRKRKRTAYEARRRMKARIEQEIDKRAAELREIDLKLAKREEILDLASKAPSVKEMRGAVAALFKNEDLDPIKEMILMVKKKGKGALPAHQKAMLLKELAQYQAPKPKSVDVQADMEHNVTVGLVDFRGVGRAVVDVAHQELTDEDYDEFEQKEEA